MAGRRLRRRAEGVVSARRALLGATLAVVLVAALAGAMLPLRSHLSAATTALVLVVPVVAGVAVGGFTAGVTATVAGFLVYDYLFIPPYYTLDVGAAQNWAALGVYGVVMVIVARVVAQLHRARRDAQQRAREVRRLFDLSGGRGGLRLAIAHAFLIWEVCVELEMAVAAHTGASQGQVQRAEPFAYAPLLRRHPDLELVLAHMGGACWGQTAELAAAFPSLAFDLCEIVAWTGAPHAPSTSELARLVQQIGSDRVMFGTDFPWYDVARTVDQVLALRFLSTEEKEGILGANAARLLSLPVTHPPSARRLSRDRR